MEFRSGTRRGRPPNVHRRTVTGFSRPPPKRTANCSVRPPPGLVPGSSFDGEGSLRRPNRNSFSGTAGGGGGVSGALVRGGAHAAGAVGAGLLVSREGGGYRERFRGRVIFPIADARGRICGFGARAIDDTVPKYLNSPESQVYHKSSVLYGLHH